MFDDISVTPKILEFNYEGEQLGFLVSFTNCIDQPTNILLWSL